MCKDGVKRGSERPHGRLRWSVLLGVCRSATHGSFQTSELQAGKIRRTQRGTLHGTVKELYHYTILPPMHIGIRTTLYSESVQGMEGFHIAEIGQLMPSTSWAAPVVWNTMVIKIGGDRHPGQPKLSNKVPSKNCNNGVLLVPAFSGSLGQILSQAWKQFWSLTGDQARVPSVQTQLLQITNLPQSMWNH